MNNSIPSAVRVLDLDADGFADRMYAGDTGGRIWRFDIITDTDAAAPGQQLPSASNLVTGGVLASLGNADLGTHPNTPRGTSTRLPTCRWFDVAERMLISMSQSVPAGAVIR